METISYGTDGLYRKGGLADLFSGAGITLGRNVYTDDSKARNTINEMGAHANRFHENMHLQQIKQMGLAKFYGKFGQEYAKFGFKRTYKKHGTLEWNADEYGYRMTGINLHCYHGKLDSKSNTLQINNI